jgi:hypothetical protein
LSVDATVDCAASPFAAALVTALSNTIEEGSRIASVS